MFFFHKTLIALGRDFGWFNDHLLGRFDEKEIIFVVVEKLGV